MNIFTIFWFLLKMFYQLLCCSFSFLTFLFNVFWVMCNLASAGIPWITVLLVVICVLSKFVKLRSPDEKRLQRLLASGSQGLYPEDLSFWPIAHRGAGYDAPENSKAALKKCVARGYRNVLVDAGLTACGQIVIVNRLTLEKAGLSGSIAVHTLESLKKINIAELHPMGKHFEAEYVLTLQELLEYLEENRLTVFLYISDNSSQMIEKLKASINAVFIERIIVITRSPVTIYQLRKVNPDVICGLWTEKSLALPLLKASTLITSIYGAFFRNIISPVIGISVVFLSKEEFNLHIAELWRNVGVRPIVYNVNSPNEKRYFQKTMKTQYLTDSLRSEPHLLMKA
ncbi:glycerophosphodiester phosphodiesterase 1 [Musca domestica]|uniref:Glycerophosphodiester phosphodiesterase 1 n=1 Tax=Musca domestica TaxID=7370 RepID=A0A1I8NJA3_MUSDO|nr:glycerophosphodiester phosphodiesterase 1 [Musca domestica]XP_058984537.1 glycerophosphodiester phosphodiesterase 1 [Musca domestica]